MIRFIHTYTGETIDVLLESGLFRKGHGLKIMHKPEYTAPYDFNNIAKWDKKLRETLSRLSCPFYIDRFQGGIGYPKTYDYDRKLLDRYKETDEFSFLGFQFHEWASNYRNDVKRITELCIKEGIAPEDVHNNKDFWEKVKDDRLELFLESYSPEEWSSLPLPLTRDEFTEGCKCLYERRLKETDGLIFPTDSYYMAFRQETQNGAKMLLPEVGWQIPNMRLQLSFTRGMAKSAGIPWGIYYECWYCSPEGNFSIPFSLTDAQDEWVEDLLHKGYGNDLPAEKREHGGSSLSLMERAWVYAYFSGAEILGEEYGVCNTFRSCRSAELSPYGKVKKRFIDFSEEYSPEGKSFTPFAVILPKEMTMPDNRLIEDYLEFSPDGFFSKEFMRDFISKAESIFGFGGKHGNMGHTLKNGGLPDICDVIYEDMPEAIEGYSYLIDLTGKDELKNTYKNVISVEEAKALAASLLPTEVSDSLHYTFRKTENGFHLLIMNNDGILHENFNPDEVLPEAAVTATLTSSDKSVKKLYGTGKLFCEDDKYRVSLEGGEWLIIEIR